MNEEQTAGKGPSLKAKIFCVMLTLGAAVVFFLLGNWQMGIHKDLKNNCTAQITGTVVNESKGRLYTRSGPEYRYLTGKYWRHIEVESDGTFTLTSIYANRGSEHEGDPVVIHYDPDEPDKYYIGDHADYYKTAGSFAYGASVFMIAVTVFLIIILNRRRSPKAKDKDRHICFNTPYGRFVFCNGVEQGYETESRLSFGEGQSKDITLFFETDAPAPSPDANYSDLVDERLGDGVTDYDIMKLSQQLSLLEAIKPGKCWRRLEKELPKAERTVRELRKLIADYFLFRPDYITENATEQQLIDGTEPIYINARRNGDMEYGFCSEDGIDAEPLYVLLKPDGTRELHYGSYALTGSNEEITDTI